MGDRSPTKEVWTQFSDCSGLGSYGVVTLAGSLGASGSLLGSDSAAHLAEELCAQQRRKGVVMRTKMLLRVFYGITNAVRQTCHSKT